MPIDDEYGDEFAWGKHPLPNCRCTIGPIMADTGDLWPTPERGRRIKPEDLRVECWACGGSGAQRVTEAADHTPRGEHLRVSRMVTCTNPLCESGQRRPFKALR